MYTTYAISDPRTRLFVYVGQTKDFERRQRQHLTAHRIKRIPRNSIKSWLKRLHKENLEPVFTILEVVETEEESLISESKWVEKLARLNHPLWNKWEEHKDIIEAADQENNHLFDPFVFTEGEAKKIGSCEQNANKTGYRIHLDKGIELHGPVTIDLLPKKSN